MLLLPEGMLPVVQSPINGKSLHLGKSTFCRNYGRNHYTLWTPMLFSDTAQHIRLLIA